MPLYDRQSMTRILDRIDELKERDRRAIENVSKGRPLGFEAVDDDEFRAWFEQQIGASPPTMLTDEETGAQWVASPWIAALSFTENGEALMKRYERIVGAR